MICKPCKDGRHRDCPDVGKPYAACACQHRAGGFTTAVLNADGTKTEGTYGCTGERGSAL